MLAWLRDPALQVTSMRGPVNDSHCGWNQNSGGSCQRPLAPRPLIARPANRVSELPITALTSKQNSGRFCTNAKAGNKLKNNSGRDLGKTSAAIWGKAIH